MNLEAKRLIKLSGYCVVSHKTYLVFISIDVFKHVFKQCCGIAFISVLRIYSDMKYMSSHKFITANKYKMKCSKADISIMYYHNSVMMMGAYSVNERGFVKKMVTDTLANLLTYLNAFSYGDVHTVKSTPE